jgi:hypothetical protein
LAIYAILDPVGKPICYFEAGSPQEVAGYMGATLNPDGELFFPPELFTKEDGRRVFKRAGLELATSFPASGVMLRMERIDPVRIPAGPLVV